jgi:hypothetical protein
MDRLTKHIRKPVEREGAEKYIRLVLLSFAISVSGTRLFLYLTGYPQLGNSTLHIAHLLWGGLLLFIGSMLLIIYANRWIYRLGAILTGVGVGLFMDEVGKFITRSNDYFFPAAAPIVYAFFLLIVLLYLEIRRPNRQDARSEMYRVFDTFEEVLDHDLDHQERADLKARLHFISEHAEHPDLSHLAEELLHFVQSDQISLVHRNPDLLERLTQKARTYEKRWFPQERLKAILVSGLGVLGIWSMRDLSLWLLELPAPVRLQQTLLELITAGRLGSMTGLQWLTTETALKAACGLILLIGAGLLIASHEKLGLLFGYFGLLLLLTIVNLLEFYFNQFSTIVPATVQFFLLLILIYYRRRYPPA